MAFRYLHLRYVKIAYKRVCFIPKIHPSLDSADGNWVNGFTLCTNEFAGITVLQTTRSEILICTAALVFYSEIATPSLSAISTIFFSAILGPLLIRPFKWLSQVKTGDVSPCCMQIWIYSFNETFFRIFTIITSISRNSLSVLSQRPLRSLLPSCVKDIWCIG